MSLNHTGFAWAMNKKFYKKIGGLWGYKYNRICR